MHATWGNTSLSPASAPARLQHLTPVWFAIVTAWARALLALASLAVAALLLGTLRGLRYGSLLQPEPAPPVAAVKPSR